jgi:hypothetical protein
MSNRGGSRYRGDDERARRSAGSRGGGIWGDDGWDEDRYAAPPPRHQGSSRGSAQGAPSSRSRRANAWDDDDSWGADEYGGGWDDPRYAEDRRSAGALGLGAYGGARRAERDVKGRSFPVRGLLVALVGIVILGGLGFGGYTLLHSQGQAAHSTVVVPDAAFATYTPGPTPTPPTNFKEFASARAKYTLSYPNTWAVSSNDAKLQQQYDYTDVFNPPNSPSHVSVEQAAVFSYYTEQKIIQGEVAGAQQSGYTFTEVPTAQAKQTVGGAQWERREYDINANGQPLHMAILATHHGGKGYVVVLVSSAAEFGNDAQSVFDPLLASFRFSA